MSQSMYVHVGQCGIQNGISLWRQMITEVSMDKDGVLADSEKNWVLPTAAFDEGSDGTWVPRAIFVDSERDVINEKVLDGVL